MKKSKRWKIEGRYYGACNKFDRKFVENYEGNHMPIHRFRDRRNWKSSKVWIPFKYLRGLIKKYINRPIEELENAYNQRAKNINNAESFRSAFDYFILDYSSRPWSRPSSFEYKIVDGILKKNPEYKVHHYRKSVKLKGWQHKYNLKHAINPGEIRDYPSSKWSVRLKDERPIYLGKLYAEVANTVLFIDVYHYCPAFLSSSKYEKDAKMKAKYDRFYKEWKNVNIGIFSINYYKYEPNQEVKHLKDLLASDDLAENLREEYTSLVKRLNPIVKNNYGIGTISPVCKIKDIEKILNSSPELES